MCRGLSHLTPDTFLAFMELTWHQLDACYHFAADQVVPSPQVSWLSAWLTTWCRSPCCALLSLQTTRQTMSASTFYLLPTRTSVWLTDVDAEPHSRCHSKSHCCDGWRQEPVSKAVLLLLSVWLDPMDHLQCSEALPQSSCWWWLPLFGLCQNFSYCKFLLGINRSDSWVVCLAM